MAAVHPSKPSHNRLRSSSDPFIDPSTSFRSPVRSSTRPPVPPPKSSKMPAPQRDITEEVRDTVTVRNSDSGPRTKVSRSQTTLPSSSNGNTRAAPFTGRRSHSQDSVLAAAAAVEKAKTSGKQRPKKGSQHADIIDRLDFTGVGPMFHHDGPFDACAPSRNRHRTKAPMLAWSSRSAADPATGQPTNNTNQHFTEEPYEPYYEPPKKKVDAIAEAWGIHEPEPFEEFFAGGGNHGDTPTSSIYGGKEGHNSTRTGVFGRRKDSRDQRDTYRDGPDDGPYSAARRLANRRSVLPPPQPIFVPDAQAEVDMPKTSPLGNRPDGPKRTKSLMHRIRKMRDAPNIPVADDGPVPPSPTNAESSVAVPSGQSGAANATRPTHRSQHSFLGLFAGGRGGSTQKDNLSPTSGDSEPFVFIEDSRSQNKELPLPPPMNASGSGEKSYEDEIQPPVPTSPGLGRTSSLLRRVRGVVKGTK